MKNHFASPAAALMALAALLASAPLLVSCGGDDAQSVRVTGVTLRQPEAAMRPGEVMSLVAEVEPPNATNKKLSWRSTNYMVAVVDAGGAVTAVGAGRAMIVVSTEDGGKMAVCDLAVGSSVTGVSVLPDVLSLTLSGTGTIAAMIAPADAVNKTVTWTTDHPNIVDLEPMDDGLFCQATALAVGSATVKATVQDGGRMAQCLVTVETGTIVGVEGVTLNKESTVIGMGSGETLVATVEPDDATIRAVRWSSSDAGVAAVSGSGLVSAVAPGSAVITARTLDGGVEAHCDVTIASVFAAGYEYSPTVSVAKVWTDGEPKGLPNLRGGANAAQVNSVYVAGGVVYAAGFEINAEYRREARLWVNGVPQSLSNGISPAWANSVFVADNNVYVAGAEETGSTTTARLWINGNPMDLSSGARRAEARQVVFADGRYYVAGHEEMGEPGRPAARLWTNDPDQRPLTNGSGGARDEQASSVCVFGGNVFVAGFEKNDAGRAAAKLWINGAPLNLTDGRSNAAANGVFAAEDNTYYVAGYEYSAAGLSVAKLWTNRRDAQGNTPDPDLTDGARNAEALSVQVLGGSAYVVGTENNSYARPTGRLWLWPDGAPKPQPSPLGNGVDNSAAISVFL